MEILQWIMGTVFLVMGMVLLAVILYWAIILGAVIFDAWEMRGWEKKVEKEKSTSTDNPQS